MLTPFCTPLRSSYRHPATSLQPTPPAAGRPLVPSFACSGPRNSRDSAPIRIGVGFLALLWQIYSRCFSSLIQDRQYGHR